MRAVAPLVAVFAASAGAGESPFVMTPGETEGELRPGGAVTLPLAFEIPPGHHLYRDQFKFTALEGSDLRVIGAEFPGAYRKKDPYLGVVEMYREKVDIGLKLGLTPEFSGEEARARLAVAFQGCREDTCFLPESREVDLTIAVLAAPGEGPAPSSVAEERGWLGRGLFLNLLIAFGVGLAIGVTPCVYPMIPITAAVIAGKERKSAARAVALAGVYILGLALVYGGLGALAGLLGEKGGFDLKRPWVAITAAVVFVVLAGYMFDLYTIQMPSVIASRVGGVRMGGIVGVFLMGGLSALVATPCAAAPVMSILAAAAASRSAFFGFAMMFAVAVGFGLVLGGVATFASMMPRPGEWMNRIKLTMGFVMLAAALYFLWPLLPAGVFPLGMGVLAVAALAFIGGYDALPREAGKSARLFKAVAILGTAAAAALLLNGASSLGWIGFAAPPANESGREAAEDDVLAALAQKAEPVVIEFSSRNCSACRRLEREVLGREDVKEALARFRVFRVDVYRARGLKERFSVTATPTVVFVDSLGEWREELTAVGFIPAEELLKRLEEVMKASRVRGEGVPAEALQAVKEAPISTPAAGSHRPLAAGSPASPPTATRALPASRRLSRDARGRRVLGRLSRRPGAPRPSRASSRESLPAPAIRRDA